ncbi:MAG: FtsX-like permease family protein [Anaerolineales bacterium]
MFRRLSLAIRSITARPSRSLLTAFGIMLGVAMILSIQITNASTLTALTKLFTETSGNADLIVLNSDLDNEGFRERILYRITDFPGVKAAVPSIQEFAALADDVDTQEYDVNFVSAGPSQLQIFGVDPKTEREVREYNLVEGKFLSEDLNSLEIVLVEDYANDKKLRLHDRVEILSPDGVETFRIVGIISKDGAGLLNNGSFGAIPLKTAQRLFNREGEYTQIDIIAIDELSNSVELNALKDAIQERIGEDYSVIFPAMQGERVNQMLDLLTMGLNFFSAIAVFVGIFLIYNAFSMTVVERTREIGMMRTIGMTRGQVTAQILIEAIILGLIGAIIGVGFGVFLSRGLIRLMEALFGQPVKEVTVSPNGVIFAMLIGIIATLVAAYLPARQAGRISPLEALRIRGGSSEGWVISRGWILGLILILFSFYLLFFNPLKGDLGQAFAMSTVFFLFMGATLIIPGTVTYWERTARPFIRAFFSGEGQLGSSNVQRAKIRTTLTVAALMVGVAMLLTLSALSDSFKNDIEQWQEYFIGGDLYVFSTVAMQERLGGQIRSVEGVAEVTPMGYVDVNFIAPNGKKETLQFTAVDPVTHSKVTSFAFAANQGDPDYLYDLLASRDAVFITTILSERYNLNQGDTIELQTKWGPRDFEVAAVVTDYVRNGMVVEGSWRVAKRYFGLDDVSNFLVDVEPGYSVDAVREAIDFVYGKRRNLTIETNQAVKEEGNQLITNSFSLFDAMAIIGMIVASLGVINTLTMNVLERTQEIGMLRGLGMTRWQIGKMILAEALMMGIIGGGLGLAFGLFLSWMLLTSLMSMMGYDLVYVLPVQGILIGILISLLISQIAAIWPARRAAGINIVEAIQYE